MAKKSKKNIKSSREDPSLKSHLLNILIFVLVTFVIYLSYSLYLKLADSEPSEVIMRTKEIPSEIIQVEVLNGCGVNGIADRFTDYLRDKGVDVVNIGNYISFELEETLIIDRIGNSANANSIADILGVKERNVFQELNKEYFLDVSIVIGKDYPALSPLK